MSFTTAQKHAIGARGNVLVAAGAGTGKTRTLVERCLNCLLSGQPRASLEEILMVTFTDAAAAEMRQRIRNRLEEELKRQPDAPHWQEQLALFETAHIGTLHSFCLKLVRQHFYELELDPQLSVMAEEEARLLAEETLDDLLQKHYAGRGTAAEAVQQLIQVQGLGGAKPIRALVLRLHHYTQTRPDPAAWLRDQLAMFAEEKPRKWQEWLLLALAQWRDRWLAVPGPQRAGDSRECLLGEQAAGNEIAEKCLAALRRLKSHPSRSEAAAVIETILAAPNDCPYGKKTLWVKPLEDFLNEANFLASLAHMTSAVPGETSDAGGETPAIPGDPLVEDWNWVRVQMTTLLELAQEFTAAFAEAKRELGVVDFHDLEQHALRLLWNHETNQPTPVALQWRKQLRFVFVDEYQDINAAQDKIIEALSREGAQANRFLVGDIKQSIYRFRLADPHIFQGYAQEWNGGQGTIIPLTDNFRSRECLLDFVNSLFAVVMRPDLGGVRYDEQARLRFGAPTERSALGRAADTSPRVELHLRVKGNGESHDSDGETASALAEVRDLEEADKEARLVALRLRELRAQQHLVWDEQTRQSRPVDWRDMAVLLRSPANKVESYAKEFSRLNVPIQVSRGGFYQSLEISDLLSLLQVLDNPLQDLPVLAVLHSPLVGLTLNELAAIRLTVTSAHFWTALVKWQEAGEPTTASRNAVTDPQSTVAHEADTFRKVTEFLDRFARWRRLARQTSLSRCLETVLTETHYDAWLLTQPRGDQRHANVQRLVGLAQEFDQFQRQGLFRFLRFVEAQQLAQTEPDVPAVAEDNAVRLMSIHQSKGLEFPVVVVADLGKPFNLSDLKTEIILDEEYGLCPQIKPPCSGKRYPSLPFWMARRRQTGELLGEELRLLYVAITRARDTLILSGSVSESNLENLWQRNDHDLSAASLAARSFADWLGLWFSQNGALNTDTALQGENALLRWVLHDETKLLERPDDLPLAGPAVESAQASEPEDWDKLQRRLSWRYGFTPATHQPAKTSVSALRRQAAADVEEAVVTRLGSDAGIHSLVNRSPRAEVRKLAAGMTAVDVGNAHHTFLQLVSLARTGSIESLKQEAQRLQQSGALTAEQVAALDFTALAAFWTSDLGQRIQAKRQFIERELAFTARFASNELARLIGQPPEPSLENEFVVVQGAADLAVILPAEIWLLDFKTDAASAKDLPARAKPYEPQLRLYARAFSQIYHRPVTQCWLYFLACSTAVPVGELQQAAPTLTPNQAAPGL